MQFVGEVLDPASDTVGVSILLITNLPSLFVERTATSSDSQAPTVISSGITGSPTAISSGLLSAGRNANLPFTTDPEPPTEMDSTATDTNALSSSTARPAFALHQLTVAGLPLLATSPATVFTALAANAYNSVLEAQHKVCLAFLMSDAMSRTKI